MENLNTGLSTNMDGMVPETENMSFLQKAIGVVISPAKTMKCIAAKPGILFPFILILAISLFSIIITLSNFDTLKEVARNAMENTYANMGMDVSSESLDFYVNFGIIIGMMSIPVALIGSWFIGTLVLFAAVKIFKGDGKLKQYMGITGYAYVITLISTLVTSAVIFSTGNIGLAGTSGSVAKSSMTSLATFLPQSMAGTLLYTLAGCLEIFSIWQYIVVGFGVAEAGKFSRKKAFIIIGAVFALNVLFVGLWASLSSLMGNIGG